MTTKTETTTPGVGAIFEASWGYDQTNVDFYQVVGVTKSGKSVKLVKIGKTFVDRQGPAGDKVVPDPAVVLSEPVTKRLQESPGGDDRYRWSVKVRSWGVWAYPWDGKPEYQTDSMFGH